MIETFVDIGVKVSSFRALAHRVASLPKPFRPIYFSQGERVRNKDASRIDDSARFSAFVDEQVHRISGFDLIGQRIRYGFFVADTRNANHESVHVGCSIILRGRQWSPTDFTKLLKLLCGTPGVERADACRYAEWEYRHLYVKLLPPISIQMSLGVDMSAFLPGLYWWTVISSDLAKRHRLNVAELALFAGHHELWHDGDGRSLHAFRLYETPDDWEDQKDRVSAFLESHRNFFSMTRISPYLERTTNKQEFDAARRPYLAGSTPWEGVPPHIQTF